MERWEKKKTKKYNTPKAALRGKQAFYGGRYKTEGKAHNNTKYYLYVFKTQFVKIKSVL